MTVEQGAFRRVVKIGRYAVKTPRINRPIKYSLKYFKWNTECNRYERKVWRKHKGDKHLVPIVFADPLGLVVIMPWVEDDIDIDEAWEIKRWNSPATFKLRNWGIKANIGDIGGSNIVISKGSLLIRDYGSSYSGKR